MMPLNIVKPGERLHRLVTIYGPTGAGKSWFGVSAESILGGRTLVLMTEGAEAGLVGFDADIVLIHTIDELRDTLRALKSDPGPYKDGVVVIDSLSQMAKFGLAIDSEEQFKKGNTKTPLNIPLDSYKRVGEDIRRTIWFARELPMHVVLVCLDRIFVSDDQTIRMIGPNLTESLSADVRAYSDVVGYLTAEPMDVQKRDGSTERQLVRRLWLQPGENFHARVRVGKGISVPPFIVSPTLPKLLKLLHTMNGEGGKNNG